MEDSSEQSLCLRIGHVIEPGADLVSGSISLPVFVCGWGLSAWLSALFLGVAVADESSNRAHPQGGQPYDHTVCPCGHYPQMDGFSIRGDECPAEQESACYYRQNQDDPCNNLHEVVAQQLTRTVDLKKCASKNEIHRYSPGILVAQPHVQVTNVTITRL